MALGNIGLFPPTSSYSSTSGRLPAVGSEITLNQIQTFFGLETEEEVNVGDLGTFLYNQPSAISSGNEISLSSSFGGKANNFMFFIVNFTDRELVATLPYIPSFNGRDVSFLTNGNYRGLTSDGTDLYLLDQSAQEVFKINPNNPSDTSGSYGSLGNFSSSIFVARSIVYYNSNLYILTVGTGGGELWVCSPNNISGSIKLGDIPTGFSILEGGAVVDDNFYVASNTTLWRINLNNTESDTSPYGEIGQFYNQRIEGMTSYDDELYVIYDKFSKATVGKINVSNPSDESGTYGEIGEFGASSSVSSISSLKNDELYSVGRSDGNIYKNLLRCMTGLRSLPSSLFSPICIASIDDYLYVISDTNDNLWRIDPYDHRSSNSISLGELPTDINSPRGMIYTNSNLYLVNLNSGTGELWIINKDNPDDTSGNYGKVGDLPSGITNPRDITEYEGDLLVINNNQLWRIDLDNPGSTTGDYGRIGTENFPDSISPRSISNFFGEIYILTFDSSTTKMYRINPTDISDTSGDYGEVGRVEALKSANGMVLHLLDNHY